MTHALLLLPSVLLLCAILLLYRRVRRQEQHEAILAEAKRKSTEAQLAAARAEELERLLRLSRALSTFIDTEGLRTIITKELPAVVGTADIWLTARSKAGTLEIGSAPTRGPWWSGTPSSGAWEMFPLEAAGKNVGVLGIRQSAGPFTDSERRTLQTIASILAVSVRNAQLFNRIRQFSMYDPLTGCLTRHQGVEMLLGALRRANRTKGPLSIVMFDLDLFKQLNDEHGHAAGDKALVAVGRLLKEELRASDLRCRYGGEEFLIILPDTGLPGAVHVAENLRRKLLDSRLRFNGEVVALAASFGVTDVAPTDEEVSVPLARADAALYAAKRTGRNRVVWRSSSALANPER